MLYTAMKTIYYTSTDKIPPGKTFDPKTAKLSDPHIKELVDSKCIIAVPTADSAVSVKTLTVTEKALKIAAATTDEELDVLAEGDERKGVIEAIAKRRAELVPE